MTTIYLIRHAEAEGNLYRRSQGRYDSLVTGRGHRQIMALERRFHDVHIDAVYSSDMVRTMETALGGICRSHHLPLHTDPRLREVNMGVWENRTWGDLARSYPEQLANFNSDPEQWKAEGGEPFAQLQARIFGAVTDIASRHDGQVIAIVSHGAAIRALMAYVTHTTGKDIAKIHHCDNTAVSLLYYNQGQLTLDYMGDNSHVVQESTLARQTWWKNHRGTDETSLFFQPMDLEQGGQQYLDAYREAWMNLYGDLVGFDDGYLDIARARSAEDPESVEAAYLGEKPAGIIELDIHHGEAQQLGWIAFYYMYPEFRGQNLAVQLLGHAVSHYRKLGRQRLGLQVSEKHQHAIAFYQRFGFEKVGETTGVRAKLWVMEKDIALPDKAHMA